MYCCLKLTYFAELDLINGPPERRRMEFRFLANNFLSAQTSAPADAGEHEFRQGRLLYARLRRIIVVGIAL